LDSFCFLIKQFQKLTSNPQARLLNIGAGNAWLERRCKEQGFDVRTLDLSAATIEKLAADGLAGDVGSIAQMPYEDGQFDAVFCSEVLEHLDDQTLTPGVAEIARVLAPGGYMIGTVPYKEDLTAGMVVCPDCGIVFHRWGHHRAFDKESLRAALSRGDLRPVTITTYAFADYSKTLPLNRLRQWLRWVLGRIGSGHVYTNLYFLAQK